jgi:NADPH:quinone reductase
MPQAVRFHKLGGPEVLQIEEVQVRHPEAAEVAIHVAAVGLNRAESMYYRGNYSQKPEFPSGLGYEVVGTVTAVGEGVDSSLLGKRIGTIASRKARAVIVSVFAFIVRSPIVGSFAQ